MKINGKNSLLRTIVWSFLILSAHESYNWDLSYRQNCSLITFTQKMSYVLRLFYYRFTYPKKDLYQALFEIKEKVTLFEKKLLKREQKTLLKIKQKYNIADDIWNNYLRDVEKIKNKYAMSMLQPDAHTVHDCAIPENTKNILKRLLEESNINPASINITFATEEHAQAEPTLLASTVIEIFKPHAHNFEIDDTYIPATIIIFPNLLREDFKGKMSNFAHEVQHLTLKHSLVQLILIEYLAYYYSISKEDFKQSEEARELNLIHEAQAEIMAAIKNPIVAECLTSFRSQHYYPDFLYEEHFRMLAIIHKWWKVHNKIEHTYFTKGLK